MSRRNRPAGVILSFLFAAIVASCTPGRDAALEGVARFRERMGRGDYKLIYAQSSDDIQGKVTEAEFTSFLTSASEALGSFREAELKRTGVKMLFSGTGTEFLYESTYSRAKVTEHFQFRVEGESAILAGYRFKVIG